MKIGTKVAVCHDGKWSRRVQGEIVATKNGHRIKVRFPEPSTNQPIEFWARKQSTVHYRRSKHSSCITYRACYGKHYGGWVDIDYWCPWFSVLKWSDKDITIGSKAYQRELRQFENEMHLEEKLK